MKPGALVTIAVGLILLIGTIMALQQPVEEIPIDEVRTRIESSQPEWANYLEDLKAQVGSSPVAKWRGTITQGQASEGTVTLEFTTQGYWNEHEIIIPMLIRDNLGYVTQQTKARYQGETLTYTFTLQQQSPPPWIEVRFPHNSRRIAFGNEGRWTAQDTP